MIEQILSAVTNFIISVIDSSSYIGIALLMSIESAAIPLPSEVIMPFSGFLVSQGRFTLFGISLAGAVGSVLGSWVTYWMRSESRRQIFFKIRTVGDIHRPRPSCLPHLHIHSRRHLPRPVLALHG